jgi:hypothetical protein
MADRLQSLNDKVNKPMACETCGGTFFIKLNAERFSNNGYNSAQIKSISPNQQPVYICLCGEPVVIKDTTAGHRADGDRQQLLVSLGLAADHLKANRVATVSEGMVSIAEHNNSLQTIGEMQLQIDYLAQVVDRLLSTSDIEIEGEGEPDTAAGEPEPQGAGQVDGAAEDDVTATDVTDAAVAAVAASEAAAAAAPDQRKPFRTGKPTGKKAA